MKKYVFIVVGVLATLVAWATLGFKPEPLPADSESARRLAAGPLPIVRLTLTLDDTSRPTPANDDFGGAASRHLSGHVWFPAGGGPWPLVVHSHGFTSNHRNGAYLAEHLASYGFVVAAVDHPLTHFSAPGGPAVGDVVNQPGDVSFVIDRLIARSADPEDALAGRVDPDRIAAMGISLGGLTSTLLGFHPDMRDTRVDAVISIAGPSAFFTRDFFARTDLPFLMLAGDADVLVPWSENARPIPEKVAGSVLVTVRDGSHTGFSGGTALLRWMKNPDALGCWSVQRNIDPDEEQQWQDLLGGTEVGIDTDALSELCAVETLPPTMNVLRQQEIARLVVRAFLESVLAEDAGKRDAAAGFLRGVLPDELSSVTYLAD